MQKIKNITCHSLYIIKYTAINAYYQEHFDNLYKIVDLLNISQTNCVITVGLAYIFIYLY